MFGPPIGDVKLYMILKNLNKRTAEKLLLEDLLHKNVKSDNSWRKTPFLVQVRTAEAGDSAGASRHCRLLFSGEQLAQVFPRPRRKHLCTFLL